MSPLNAKVVVDNICEGLKQIDPENDEYYETNRDAYLTELESLHSDIVAGLDAVQNRVFMVYHPSFGYFAKEYDLEMVPVEEEGKEPTAAGLARLIDQAVERDISVVFTSPQFNPQMAQVIADGIGGTVVSVDPLARNYIDSMRVLLSELVQALE
jgi:zinc transport system substrate-binding protein